MELQGCLITFHFMECFRVQPYYTVYTLWLRFTLLSVDRSLLKSHLGRNSCLVGLASLLAPVNFTDGPTADAVTHHCVRSTECGIKDTFC